MKVFFLSFFLFTLVNIFGQGSKLNFYDSQELEIATTKPIVIKLLNEKGTNAAIWNSCVKKYAEQTFGNDRIYKCLIVKEFRKFAMNKKNRGEYMYLSIYNDLSKPSRTIIYLGFCGYSITSNASFCSVEYEIEKREKFYPVTEADIKFSFLLIKNQLDYALKNNHLSFKEAKADLLKKYELEPKSLNPNAKEIKELTLLIDKNIKGFDEDINFFITNYKYKVELVDKSRIDNAILNNEKGIAFIYNIDKSIYKTEDLTLIYDYLYRPKMGLGVHFYPSAADYNILQQEYLDTLHSAID